MSGSRRGLNTKQGSLCLGEDMLDVSPMPNDAESVDADASPPSSDLEELRRGVSASGVVLRASVCLWQCVCARACGCCICNIYTYIRTYVHTCIRTYVHTYIRTYVHTYIRTYVHTYIHACIHTYTHTHSDLIGADRWLLTIRKRFGCWKGSPPPPPPLRTASPGAVRGRASEKVSRASGRESSEARR